MKEYKRFSNMMDALIEMSKKSEQMPTVTTKKKQGEYNDIQDDVVHQIIFQDTISFGFGKKKHVYGNKNMA